MTDQVKHIPTQPILDFVAVHGGIGCHWYDLKSGNERSVRNAMPEGTPDHLVLAKMKKLIRKGLVDGCTCGCRGDFELPKPEEGSDG